MTNNRDSLSPGHHYEITHILVKGREEEGGGEKIIFFELNIKQF